MNHISNIDNCPFGTRLLAQELSDGVYLNVLFDDVITQACYVEMYESYSGSVLGGSGVWLTELDTVRALCIAVALMV